MYHGQLEDPLSHADPHGHVVPMDGRDHALHESCQCSPKPHDDKPWVLIHKAFSQEIPT